MPLYMLDTDICIYVIRERSPRLAQRFNRYAEQLCISAITLGELLFGAEKSSRRVQNLEAIEAFTARLEVIDFTMRAAAHFGEIRAALETSGTPCGAYDLLIGAHARSVGLTVVTNNVREFARMPGVKTETWQ
jgi:tRNA(fMet)-specific endonuclease VapC